MSLWTQSWTASSRNVKGLTYFEGSCCALMVSFGEAVAVTYLSQAALSGTSLGLLTTLPAAAGAFFQVLIPFLFYRQSCAALTRWAVAAQIVGLLMLAFVFEQPQLSLSLLGLGLGFYWVGGMTAGAPWQEWLSRLVPEAEHNSFFAKRQAFISAVMLVSLVISGILMNNGLSMKWVAHALGFAAVMRFFSLLSLFAHPNPPAKHIDQLFKFELPPSLRGSTSAARDLDFAKFAQPLQKHGVKALMVLSVALFLFRISVQVSAPFYNPYMLQELHLSLAEYTFLNALPLLVRVFVISNWGLLLDQKRSFEGFYICLAGVALLPVLWTFANGWVALSLLQLLSGIVWSGFELISILLIQKMYPNTIMRSVSMFTAFGALGSVGGALIGGQLRDAGLSYSELFWISGVSRCVAGAIFLYTLRRMGAFRFRHLKLRAGLATVLNLRPSLQFMMDLGGRKK